MRKSVRKVCPPPAIFSNVRNSDVFAGVTVAWKAYNAGNSQEGTSQHVDSHGPHWVPSKFLLRVWQQDRAAALVCLDQQKILRQVCSRVCPVTLGAAVDHDPRACTFWSVDWTWLPSRASAADN